MVLPPVVIPELGSHWTSRVLISTAEAGQCHYNTQTTNVLKPQYQMKRKQIWQTHLGAETAAGHHVTLFPDPATSKHLTEDEMEPCLLQQGLFAHFSLGDFSQQAHPISLLTRSRL